MSLAGTALVGLQGLLGVAMAGAGGAKLAGQEDQIENFERFGYPQEFRIVTGSLEILAALGLLLAFGLSDVFALAGGVVTVVVLTGAILTHIRVDDSLSQAAPAAVLFVLALVVIWGAI